MVEINRMYIEWLRSQYGDAFYLLYPDHFESNFIELQSAFRSIYPKSSIAYSYKTNYIPLICKMVARLGGYAEIVSEMELLLAEQSGNDYSRIIWNGPIKPTSVLESFLLKGGLVNVDSLDELIQIIKISERHNNCHFNVGLRCNYDIDDGIISRFGIDVGSDDFIQAIRLCSTSPNISIQRLHCHYANRQYDCWQKKVEGMLELIESFGIIPDQIDVGGGLFGKMNDSFARQFGDNIPSYDEYARIIADPFESFFCHKNKIPELIIEPGTALISDCMKFVCFVQSIKDIRGKQFATVTGSQGNINMRGVNPPLEVVKMGGEQRCYLNLDIVGYTCIEGDVLYHGYCGNIATGDAVVISNCGSYSIVMKPPFILPNVPVLNVSGSEVTLLRRKESFDDLFCTFVS